MKYLFLFFFIQLNGIGKSKNIDSDYLLPEKINNYCEKLIVNNNNLPIKNTINIFNPYLFKQYIENNQQYLENKLQIRFNKMNKFFLWEIIPDIRTSNFSDYSFDFRISSLIESIINNIFPSKVNEIIYQQKQIEKQLILDFQSYLKSLIKIVGDIRSKYRNIEYLSGELEKKKDILELLPKDELEAVYEIENNLLNISIDLINLFSELEEIIIKSNLTITKEHIENLFNLYNEIFKNIKENTDNYKNTEYLNMEKLKINIKDMIPNKKKIILKKPLLPSTKSFFSKLPVNIKLTITNNFYYPRLINTITKDNFSFSLSVNELINNIINYFFEKKIYKIKLLDENNKWKNMKKNQELYINTLDKKYENLQKILLTLNTILKNEKLLSVVKVKKIINNHMEFINTEEEIIGNILTKIMYEILLIKD
jgi:hypothetical protein